MADDFLDRVRADLAESRRRRLGELAAARGLVTPSRFEELLRSTLPLEETLGLPAADLDRLLRELDGPRYEVGEKLGEGAVSVVHRGFDRELGRPVAIKFLRESLLVHEKVRERFQREAQSLARMDHPNVVRVHDAVLDGDRAFLVMELVEGGSLGAAIRRDPRASVALLEQAARGVQHAHERGIVHRDLKPENILVGAVAKVADFGLAHLAESGAALTRSGTILGTPLYMAPEQVRGGREIGVRTDVYALGSILYHLLAGRPPFEGDEVSRVYDRILHEDPVPPRRLAPAVPWELEAVALKAMEKDPARRYPSAAAFADELRRHLAGEPVEARPVSSLARAWRRHRRWAAWGAAALLVALVVVGRGRAKLYDALDAAETHEREGRLQAARDAYLVALGLDVADPDARAGADRTAAELQRTAALLETAKSRLDMAYAASYNAQVDVTSMTAAGEVARGMIEQVLARDGGLALGHYRLGEAWEIHGSYAKAESAYRRAAALDPRFGPARYRRGRILLWRGYLASLNMWTTEEKADRERGERIAREGMKEIEAAREGFDDDVRRGVAEAMLAYLRPAPDEVRRLCAEGIRKHGRREGVEEFHWLEGLVLGKDRAAQVRAYDAALALRPRFPLALYSRAWAAGGRSDFDAAIRCAPGFSEAYIFRGSSYLADPKDPAAAAADFEELIRRGEHLAPAYNGRGFARLQLGDPAGAAGDFTEAIRLKPENYHLPWIGRAEAHLLRKDYDGAIADAARAVEMDPGGDTRRRALALRVRAQAEKGDR